MKVVAKITLQLGLVAFALALPPLPAEAKGIKVKIPRIHGMPGKGSYGPDVLRPEQLEECLVVEKKINQGADWLDTTDAALSTQSAQLDRLGKEIDQSAFMLDRTSLAAVEAHNAKVRNYQALARDYDAQAKAFNVRVGEHNAGIEKFNSTCANKKYYDSDMKAALAKLGT